MRFTNLAPGFRGIPALAAFLLVILGGDGLRADSGGCTSLTTLQVDSFDETLALEIARYDRAERRARFAPRAMGVPSGDGGAPRRELLPVVHARTSLTVKLRDELFVDLAGGRLGRVFEVGALDEIIDRFIDRDELAGTLPTEATWERVFQSRNARELFESRKRGEGRTGRRASNLSNWFVLRFADQDVLSLADRLRGSKLVEHVEVMPGATAISRPRPSPSVVGSLSSTWAVPPISLADSPTGQNFYARLGIPAVWSDKGITGAGADLTLVVQGLPSTGQVDMPTYTRLGEFFSSPNDPGDSASFILAGAPADEEGKTGIAYGANFYAASAVDRPSSSGCAGSGPPTDVLPGRGIDAAVKAMGAGGTIVIPQVIYACKKNNLGGCMAVPNNLWSLPVDHLNYLCTWEAIQDATSNGIPVFMEAGADAGLINTGRLEPIEWYCSHSGCISGGVFHENGAVYVRSWGPNANFSAAFPDRMWGIIDGLPAGPFGSVVYGSISALVQSSRAHFRASTTAQPLPPIWTPSLGLTSAIDAVERGLNLGQPSAAARIRVQASLLSKKVPPGVPISLNGTITLHADRKKPEDVTFFIYNDGKEALTITEPQVKHKDGEFVETLTFARGGGPPASIASHYGGRFTLHVNPEIAKEHRYEVRFKTNDSDIPGEGHEWVMNVRVVIAATDTPSMEIRDHHLQPVTDFNIQLGQHYQIPFEMAGSPGTPSGEYTPSRRFQIRNTGKNPLILKNFAVSTSKSKMWAYRETLTQITLPLITSSTTLTLQQNEDVWIVVYPTHQKKADYGSAAYLDFDEPWSFSTNDPESTTVTFKFKGRTYRADQDEVVPYLDGRPLVAKDLHFGTIHDDQWRQRLSGLLLQFGATGRDILVDVKDVSEDAQDLMLLGEDPKKAKKWVHVEFLDKFIKADARVRATLSGLAGLTKAWGNRRSILKVSWDSVGGGKSYYLTLRSHITGSGPPGLKVWLGNMPPGSLGKRAVSVASSDETEVPIGSAVDMGSTPIGTPLVRDLRIHNGTSGTFTVHDVAVTGSAAFMAQILTPGIAPGDDGVIRVTFFPERIGSQTASVSFRIGTNPVTEDDYFSADFSASGCNGADCSGGLPAIKSFKASERIIDRGQSTTLSWEVDNASRVSISNGVGDVSATGTRSVTPSSTIRYVLTATSRDGTKTVTAEMPITVIGDGPPGSPSITQFGATPTTIQPGGAATLAWTVTGATEALRIDPLGDVTGSEIAVSPSSSTNYVLWATNASGTSSRKVRLTVGTGGPVVNSFTVEPKALTSQGDPVTVTWDVSDATTIEVGPGISVGQPVGSATVYPSKSMLYTLTARNDKGTAYRSENVTVPTVPPGTPPVIKSFSASSTTVAAGSPVTLSWLAESADIVVLAPPVATVDLQGSKTFQPLATTTYTLFARNDTTSVSAEVTVTVTGGAAVPSISELSASPDPLQVGATGRLQWSTSGATLVSITPDYGTVEASGQRPLIASKDTMYVLEATNPAGSTSRAVVVKTVLPPEQPLSTSIELLRGESVQNGIRLEPGGSTNLYDPVIGYEPGELKLLIVNRASTVVKIEKMALEDLKGGGLFFPIDSLRGQSIQPSDSRSFDLDWSRPFAPNAYAATLKIWLVGQTTPYRHEFRFGAPVWGTDPSTIAVDLTDETNGHPFSFAIQTDPFTRPANATPFHLGAPNTWGAARRGIRVHNRGSAAFTVAAGWCASPTFDIDDTPISVPASGFGTLEVEAGGLYRAEISDCILHLQEPGDTGSEGRFVIVPVAAYGLDVAPDPSIWYHPNGEGADDFAIKPKAREVAIKLKPNRPYTIKFEVANNWTSNYNSLHLLGAPKVTGAGFKLGAGGYYKTWETKGSLLEVEPQSDAAAFDIQFAGKPAGVYTAVVKVRMWAGSRTQPPYEWDHEYEIHIRMVVGKGGRKVSQGNREIDNGGGFDADDLTTFTIENTTDSPLGLSSLAVPFHYKVVSGLPKKLPAGARATFVISQQSAPAGNGPHYVSISTDDPDDPHFKMRENHRPLAVTDIATVGQGDTFVSINVLGNDTDADGDSLSLWHEAIVTPPTKGILTILPDDVIVYSPNEGAMGNDGFIYAVTDGNGAVVDGHVGINLGAHNQEPLARPDSATTKTGRPVQIEVTLNDRDPDGDLLVYDASPLVIAPLYGSAVPVDDPAIENDLSFIYTPAAGFAGTDSFTYKIGDPFGKTATAVVTVTVVNTQPIAHPDTASTKPGREVKINVVANDVDEDGDVVTLISNPIVEPPSSGTAVRWDASTILYTPKDGFAGTDMFTYQLAGSSSPTSRAVVTVQVLNTAPTAVPDSVQTTRNNPISIEVLANDSDAEGDQIWLTQKGIGSQPGHGTASRTTNSVVTYSPARTFVGVDTFTYEVTDNFWGKSVGTVTVEVINTEPPVAWNDHVNTRRDTAVTIHVIDNDDDPDGEVITLTNLAIPTGPKNGKAVKISNRSITYTPNAQWAGNDIFEYEIADTSGNKDRAWVAVHVGRTKNLPVLTDDTVTTTANQSISFDVIANDAVGGGTVFLTSKPIMVKPDHGVARRMSDRELSYTPNPDFVGQDVFAYEASDIEGSTVVAFVNVTVTAGNLPPHATADGPLYTGIGQATNIDVVSNDTDPENDILTLAAEPFVNVAQNGPRHGTVIRADDLVVTYTPQAGFSGNDSFRYRISDGQGGSAEAMVNVTVTSDTNRPPVAEDDTATTAPGTAVTINVVANDSDIDAHKVKVSLIAAPASNGTAVIVSSDAITYTPKAGFTGVDRFEYEATDDGGLPDRAFVDVTVGGTGPNQNPVAVDDAVTVKENSFVDLIVTANDSDPDGDPVMLSGNYLQAGPWKGTLSKLSNTKLRYTPNPEFVGADSFHYEISDGRTPAKKAKAWVRVTVRNANTRPEAVDDIASTQSGQMVTINLIKNDSDPDGDTVRLRADEKAIEKDPEHGTATRHDNASVKYTPDAGFHGTDRFRYEIADGKGGRHTAWVNVTVTSGPSAGVSALGTAMTDGGLPPVADNDAAESLIGMEVPVVVLSNDLSPTGHSVILAQPAVITPPLFGTVQRVSDTVLTYTSGPSFSGNDRFEYAVVDAQGETTQAWVTVQLPGDNQPPVPVEDTVPVAIGKTVTINPLTNDTDPDQDPLELTARGLTREPLHGIARRISKTSITYEPVPDFTGTDSFTYEITDGRGGVAEAAVNLIVTNGSVPPVAHDDTVTAESGWTVMVDVLANDADPDGGALRIVSSVPPSRGTLLWTSDREAIYQSDRGFSGSDSFRYTISDEHGLVDEAVVSVTVTITNHPPIANNDVAETKTRTPVLIGVLVNDGDIDNQKLKVVGVTQPARGTTTINGSQSVTYTPAATFAGTDTFTYTVTDGKVPVKATVTVTVVNSPPNPRSEILAAREDQATPFYAGINLLNNDTDPDGDELKVTSYEQPLNGTFQIAADLSMVAYTPKPNWSGMDTFHYTVSDPFGESVRLMSQISVSAVNDAPVAGNDSFTMYNNQALTLTQAQVVANDTDLEGHTITVYSVGTPSNGTAQKLADGSIRYEPYGSFVGTDTFTYRIEDSGGGAYGDGVISVTVASDTKPVAGYTFSCNYLVCSFNASTSSDDRGITSYQWTMGDGRAASGTTFSHTYTGAGSYTVRLTVYDVLGQTGAVSKTVTVIAANTPPYAMNDSFSAPEDQATGFYGSNLLANDSDAEGNTPLRITAVTLPTKGTLTYAPDFSTFTYKGNTNWFGSDSFTYTVADSLGATSQGTVQLTVNSVNDAPVAGTDSLTVYKNQLLTITPQQLLANDSDLEGHSLSVSAVGAAVNGTVQRLANESIEFRPFGEYVGAASFDYTLRDAPGATSTGRVNVTVLPDNAPVANFNVTCNGRVCSFDASASTDDRGIVSYQWTLGNNSSANGKTFSYTYPTAGTYQVRLTVYDVMGQTSIAAKWITPAEPPPDAVNDLFSFSKGYPRSVSYVDMLRNDTDPNGDVLSVISNSAASIGTVTCDATSCLFQPPGQYWYGHATYTYTVSDGHGKTDTATVTIEFRP